MTKITSPQITSFINVRIRVLVSFNSYYYNCLINSYITVMYSIGETKLWYIYFYMFERVIQNRRQNTIE